MTTLTVVMCTPAAGRRPALEGAAPELTGAPGSTPLLVSSDLVYLGADPMRETTDWEREQATALDLTIVDQMALCDDPRGAARRARSNLASGPFVAHLDVDVLDFIDAPIAENVNGRNRHPRSRSSSAPLFNAPRTARPGSSDGHGVGIG